MSAVTINAGATARAPAVTCPPLIDAIASAPAATKTSANVPNISAASRLGQGGSPGAESASPVGAEGDDGSAMAAGLRPARCARYGGVVGGVAPGRVRATR